MATKTTKDRLLDEAELLCQTRGFNAFSFKALAEALEIKTASVHYHFPTKADLGLALVQRYRERFESQVARVSSGRSSRDRIASYVDIFARLARSHRLCLCGSLAGDFATLSDEVQGEVRDYFAASEAWLEGVLEAGRTAGEVSFQGEARATSRVLIGMLEGTMLSARASGSPNRLRDTKRWILDFLAVPTP
ncbi:MAG: TetR/AcrR family transcriptional regulator [Planctomycetes bacterium]|nr:TetR/AcrR family transcriptional regulator [Planctomycetota bacterium]